MEGIEAKYDGLNLKICIGGITWHLDGYRVDEIKSKTVGDYHRVTMEFVSDNAGDIVVDIPEEEYTND